MGSQMQADMSASPTLPTLPHADAIVRFHDAELSRWQAGGADEDYEDHEDHDNGDLGGVPQRGADDVWRAIDANHRHNRMLWREEDRARRTDVGAEAIAAGKRLIDRHNQLRNDAVEAIDEALLARLPAEPQPQPEPKPASARGGAGHAARLSSETAGAMIDRLSILALKIFHMRAQAHRAEAGAAHMAACAARLERLVAQRNDLAGCLDRLLNEAATGAACFRVYRQFKMYNDPALNPSLYGRRENAGAGGGP
jgi:hypothetical protein